jgi:hypothetical protein
VPDVFRDFVFDFLVTDLSSQTLSIYGFCMEKIRQIPEEMRN